MDHMGGYVSRGGGVGVDAGKPIQGYHQYGYDKHNSMHWQPQKFTQYGGGRG